jgi:hypothetical protein
MMLVHIVGLEDSTFNDRVMSIEEMLKSTKVNLVTPEAFLRTMGNSLIMEGEYP